MNNKISLFLVIIITLFISSLLTIFSSLPAGYGFLSGAAAWLLPAFYFAWRVTKDVFPPKPKSNYADLLKILYIAEAVKLLLSIGLLILFIKLLPIIIVPAFLSGYIIAILITEFIYYKIVADEFNTNKRLATQPRRVH